MVPLLQSMSLIESWWRHILFYGCFAEVPPLLVPLSNNTARKLITLLRHGANQKKTQRRNIFIHNFKTNGTCCKNNTQQQQQQNDGKCVQHATTMFAAILVWIATEDADTVASRDMVSVVWQLGSRYLLPNFSAVSGLTKCCHMQINLS